MKVPTTLFTIVMAGSIATAPLAAGSVTATPLEAEGPLVIRLADRAPYFDPPRARAARGTTVVWRNEGPGLSHSVLVTGTRGIVRSGVIRPGESWTHRFAADEDAVVELSCEIHPYMRAVLLVGDPPASRIAAVETRVESRQSAALSGAIREYPLPAPGSVPGIVAVDQSDHVWFTMGGGGFAGIEHLPRSEVGRLGPDGDLRTYTLPTARSGSSGLAIAPDGTVVVTELFGNRIARLDPRTGHVEETALATPEAWPTGIGVDASGTVWANATKGNALVRLSQHGVLTELPLPTRQSRATGLLVHPDGSVWLAARDANKLVRLTPDGTFVEYALPTPRAKPTGLALDPQGRVWFTERDGNRIGVLEEGRIREYPLPRPGSAPFSLLVDRDGQVWFTELFGNRIGVLDPRTGRIREYDLPTPDAWPGGLAMDSQGNLWFSMQLAGKIGVLLRSETEALHAASDAPGAGH